jgi:hypothetical protein
MTITYFKDHKCPVQLGATSHYCIFSIVSKFVELNLIQKEVLFLHTKDEL